MHGLNRGSSLPLHSSRWQVGVRPQLMQGLHGTSQHICCMARHDLALSKHLWTAQVLGESCSFSQTP